MSMNSLIFAAVLGCLLVTGGVLYFTNVQTVYAPAQNVTNLPDVSGIQNNLSIMTQNATGQAMTQSVGQDPVGALLGYFNSSFQALKSFVTAIINVPGIFLAFVNIMLNSLGFEIPTFVIAIVGIAVFVVIVFAVLYYLTKVRG